MFLNTVIEVTRKCNLQWTLSKRMCTINNFSEWLKEYNEVYERQCA